MILFFHIFHTVKFLYLVELSTFFNIFAIFTEVTEQQLRFVQTPVDLMQKHIKNKENMLTFSFHFFLWGIWYLVYVNFVLNDNGPMYLTI